MLYASDPFILRIDSFYLLILQTLTLFLLHLAFDRIILKGEKMKSYPGFKEYCRIRSDNSGITPIPLIQILRYSQNDIPNLRQVFFKLVKVSQHRRPDSLQIEPLILRFFSLVNFLVFME